MRLLLDDEPIAGLFFTKGMEYIPRLTSGVGCNDATGSLQVRLEY